MTRRLHPAVKHPLKQETFETKRETKRQIKDARFAAPRSQITMSVGTRTGKVNVVDDFHHRSVEAFQICARMTRAPSLH